MKKRESRINLDIHHSKVFSSEKINIKKNIRESGITTIKSGSEDYDLKNKKKNIIENTHLSMKKIYISILLSPYSQVVSLS